MEPREPTYLHKETRVDLEPAACGSVVEVLLPSASGHPRSSQRKTTTSDRLSEEERAFRAQNLSTTSSIFHRTSHRFPRSFLWRALEDDTVLSIRTIDVYKSQQVAEPNLVLNLRFPCPFRSHCVALCESEEHDAVNLFVIDQSNYLYALTLRPEAFRKRSSLENGLGESCRTYLPSAFSFRHPHRIIATSASQIIVTLHDGGIIRFDRAKSHESGSLWKETFYNPTGWAQGLRNLLPFHGGHTIKHGRINMEPAAATSLAIFSPPGSSTPLLFTVCLDHRLRIWNVNNGQIVFISDLLNAERQPHEVGKWTVDPSQINLVRVLERPSGGCLCTTYSPIGLGEFKIWKVSIVQEDSILVEDAYPDLQLTPPAPSLTDVWTLADFTFARSTPDGLALWTLWKNNMTYRVQNIAFESQNARESWADSWTTVFSDSTVPTAQTSSASDPSDPSDRWLNVILYPGRFSHATLQTALTMYERGLGSPRPGQTKGARGLAESICAVIGSSATLDKAASGDLDYEQFRSTSETQWRRFYRLLIEIDKQRGEALSLSVDADQGIPWVVCADYVGAIRTCGDLDRVYHNIANPGTEFEDVASLISAAVTFLEGFSDGMWQQAVATLKAELFEESSKTDYERIQFFSDKSAFWRQITDEDAAQVVGALGAHFQLVTPDLYRQLIALAECNNQSRARAVAYPMTDFGKKLVIRSVQETAELYWLVFFSQLLLLVHMEFEFDQDEDALHSRFDVGQVYQKLGAILRQLELLRWLTRTECDLPSASSETNSASPQYGNRKAGVHDGPVATVLEQRIDHFLGFGEGGTHSLASTITGLSADICAPDSDIELDPALTQCSLLGQGRADLALELSPFCSQDPFPVYVQGRTLLALKDFDAAAGLFRRAAIGLSTPSKRIDRYSGGLLDSTDWSLLHNGLPRYFAHVANLFDKQRAHSYVVDFTRLSLQFAESSVADVALIKTDMLSRLFSAATSISRFDIAYSTLLAIPDRALQHSCLRRLVERMCETSHNAELVALPFSQLQEAVDSVLEEKCDSTLDIDKSTRYHNILYSWRVTHGDYRGAAAVQLHRLQRLKSVKEGELLTSGDSLDTPVTQTYLKLINTLSCMDPEKAWVVLEKHPSPAPDCETKAPLASSQPSSQLSEVDSQTSDPAASVTETAADEDDCFDSLDQNDFLAAMRPEANEPQRELITLGQVRKQYQQELDRMTAIQNNQFGFCVTEEDEMDES